MNKIYRPDAVLVCGAWLDDEAVLVILPPLLLVPLRADIRVMGRSCYEGASSKASSGRQAFYRRWRDLQCGATPSPFGCVRVMILSVMIKVSGCEHA